jgi:lauroyl/myristoyl acyltransferase
MQRLLKLEEDLAFQVTSEYLARPLRDFVVLRRILNGREDHKNWLVEEKNVELLQSLRASGKSFIIATGHFSREAFVPLYFQSTIPENITSLVAYPIPATLNPYVLLVSIRWAQMTEYLQLERPDMKIINSGQINNLRALVASLNGSGNVLIMSADSPWAPQYGKCLKRRFVGIEGREFAIGTATLSRLSQCPIVTCYPHLDKSGKVIIEWGKRFDPYPREDKKSDQQLTDLILNEIEEQIKLRPSQYAVDFLD